MRHQKLNKYKNIVEVLQVTSRLRKLFGIAVYELTTDTESCVVTKFSWTGCLIFCIWRIVYYFCSYKAFHEDQTILRVLYNTRLKQYGDVFERVVSITLFTITLWKMPFHLNVSPNYLQKCIDVDCSIQSLGVKIDHNRDACRLLIGISIQIFAGCARLLSICIPLYYLEISLPFDLVFQAAVTNVFALILSTHYCNYVGFLTMRYSMVNAVLTKIKDQKCWENEVFARSRQPTSTQSMLQSLDKDKHVCDKMKACAKTYGLIFAAVESCQVMYGFLLVCTLLFCFLYLILYLFYFMEATAGGLFHDLQHYTFFLINIFWQILYALCVLFLNIYFSESAVKEAKKTSYIVHEIINSDISPQITVEALQFSTRLMHQVPVFTACGLCRIDYMLLLKGASSVTTFLVILLQFVMD